MNIDDTLELLESDIWNVVRRAIQSGQVVRVMEAATRIASGRPNVMSVNAIAELLADAALSAGLPIDVEGFPLTPSHGYGREIIAACRRHRHPMPASPVTE